MREVVNATNADHTPYRDHVVQPILVLEGHKAGPTL